MDKLAKIKKLADAMYYAGMYLTTDASRLHKAMNDYHQFIIHEYKEKPVEEPVNRSPADVESAMQEVEEKSRVFTEAHQGEDTDTILAQMRGEEPVSEELEKAAKEHRAHGNYGGDINLAMEDSFKLGAIYHKQQMMAKAVDATLLNGNLIKQKHTTHPLRVGDKVKIIVIKED